MHLWARRSSNASYRAVPGIDSVSGEIANAWPEPAAQLGAQGRAELTSPPRSQTRVSIGRNPHGPSHRLAARGRAGGERWPCLDSESRCRCRCGRIRATRILIVGSRGLAAGEYVSASSHSRDELGTSETVTAHPMQTALVSPIVAWLAPAEQTTLIVAVTTLVALSVLALQLHFMLGSESMGDHDSEPDDWWRID